MAKNKTLDYLVASMSPDPNPIGHLWKRAVWKKQPLNLRQLESFGIGQKACWQVQKSHQELRNH